MRKLFLLSLTLTLLFSPACGTLPTKAQLTEWTANADKAIVGAGKLADKATAATEALTARVDKAFKDLEAKGFDTSSIGNLWESVKQNPGTASGSLGSIALAAAAMMAGYKRKKSAPVAAALNAVVDTIDSLPDDVPVTKADLLARNAAHPLMGPEARVAVAQAQSR